MRLLAIRISKHQLSYILSRSPLHARQMPDTHIHFWDSITVDGKRKSSFESNFSYERVKLTFTTKYVLIDSEVIKRLKDYETKALKLREKLARRFVHQIITSNNVSSQKLAPNWSETAAFT